MRVFKIMAFAALALPALAAAQVGPNPAVSGGSLDPTVGASTDTMTAPQDARIGTQAGGNVIDRTIGTKSDATVADGAADASMTPGGSAAGTTATTTANTKATTKPMKPARKTRR